MAIQIGWADIIFVMEKSHANRLCGRFPEAMDGKNVVALHIPDDYTYMQSELVDELRAKVSGHLGTYLN